MATTTTVQLGSYNPLTDSFTLGLDINDRVTYFVDEIKTPQARKQTVQVWNIRTVGTRYVKQQHQEREITITLSVQASTVDGLRTALQNLQAQVEGMSVGVNPTYASTPAVLKLQAPNASTARYSLVLKTAHTIDYAAKEVLSSPAKLGGKKRLSLVFSCWPFSFSIPRQWLANGVSNPGFEAPSGPGVQVFSDSFANANAYSDQQYVATILSDSPLRYYRLNDPIGALTVADSGSQNQSGTVSATGVTLRQTGIVAGGYAALFTAASSGDIVLASPGTLPTGNSAWTLAAWVFITANPATTANIVAIGTGSTAHGTAAIQVNTSGQPMLATNGTAITSGTALTTNAWHYIAATYDGTTLTLYQDAVSKGTATPGAMVLTGAFATIGASASSSPANFFQGDLDEVGIYGAALSSARITAHYNAGLQGMLGQDKTYYSDVALADLPARYYRLDEASGTTAYEAVTIGGSNNGTYTGGVTLGTTGLLTGDSDTAVTCNGTTGYVNLPTTGLPTGNGTWSVAIWFRIASAPTGNATLWWLGAGTGTRTGLWLEINAGTTSAQLIIQGGGGPSASAALTTNASHLAVVTWDGTTMRVYIDNNAALTSTPGAMALTYTSGGASIGANFNNASPTQFFPGILDECSIYPGVVLSAGRVSTYWTTGTTTPATQSNTLLIPAGGRASFGSPAWGALNQWQVRWRQATGLTASFYLHYTDANDYLAVTVSPTTLALVQVVGGTTHTLASTGTTPINGRMAWLQVTQFPTVSSNPPQVQALLLVDSAGSPGGGAAVGLVATFDAVTALVGAPQFAASGAALGLGGNFANVHSVSLFGPGGWQFVGTQGGAAVASGAWDGARPEVGMSGNGGANTYPNGPVTSFGAARIDFPPAGTVNAYWTTYGGGAPAGTSAIPVQTSGNVMQVGLWARSSGLHATHGFVQLVLNEYDTNGAFLRQTFGPSVLGSTLNAGWTQITMTVPTGASTAYVGLAITCGDTSVAGESANAMVWLDNVQVWDQTRTGMSSMPYCELSFPQSPAQLMVSGLLGDAPAPAVVDLGLYFGTWNLNQSARVYLGRRAQTTPGMRLCSPAVGFYGAALAPTATPVLDSSSYGGYYISAQMSNIGWSPRSIDPLVQDAFGTYRLLARGWTADASPTGVEVRWTVQERLQPWYGLYASNNTDFVAEAYGQFSFPFSTGSAWTLVDFGGLILPPFPPSSLGDPSQMYLGPRAQMAGSSGSSFAARMGWVAYIPTDGDTFIATMYNPVNGPFAVSSQWVYAYWDGTLRTTPYSVESSPIPNPAHSGNAFGGAGTAAISVNPVADTAPTVDPMQTTPNSGGLGVNQWCLVALDNTTTILPCAVEMIYSPQYLYPL